MVGGVDDDRGALVGRQRGLGDRLQAEPGGQGVRARRPRRVTARRWCPGRGAPGGTVAGGGQRGWRRDGDSGSRRRGRPGRGRWPSPTMKAATTATTQGVASARVPRPSPAGWPATGPEWSISPRSSSYDANSRLPGNAPPERGTSSVWRMNGRRRESCRFPRRAAGPGPTVSSTSETHWPRDPGGSTRRTHDGRAPPWPTPTPPDTRTARRTVLAGAGLAAGATLATSLEGTAYAAAHHAGGSLLSTQARHLVGRFSYGVTPALAKQVRAHGGAQELVRVAAHARPGEGPGGRGPRTRGSRT